MSEQPTPAVAPDQGHPFVLVTGVTGYIGTRLVPALLAQGRHVRVLTRDRSKLAQRAWLDQVDVVEGDAMDRGTLERALAGTSTAYYLLHSMDGKPDFERRDRAIALRFAQAAREAGVHRIVYLSGLHPANVRLSAHLHSRKEVGDILMASGVPTAVLQAAVILGSGSASFEMMRYLTRRLPAMVAPKWLRNRIQPIAVEDVLHYLTVAADLPPELNRTFDIGGPDVLTYADMIRRFATIDGLSEEEFEILGKCVARDDKSISTRPGMDIPEPVLLLALKGILVKYDSNYYCVSEPAWALLRKRRAARGARVDASPSAVRDHRCAHRLPPRGRPPTVRSPRRRVVRRGGAGGW